MPSPHYVTDGELPEVLLTVTEAEARAFRAVAAARSRFLKARGTSQVAEASEALDFALSDRAIALFLDLLVDELPPGWGAQ